MKKIFSKIFYTLFISIILGSLTVGAVIGYFSLDLPKIQTLADYRPAIPSQILAKDGTVLAELGIERREIVAFEDIPKIIIDAFLSAEDDSFYEHKGVDYLGVLRALIKNIKAGRVVQGGSTITQQVAKSLLLSRERSISRKIKDFLLAQRIEKKFTKNEILFLYLNQVYLGGGYYGVKTAFRGYFEKELEETSIAEAALIAGLLVAPGRYSPYKNPEYSKKRQMYVLGRMLATGKITNTEYEQAVKEKIKISLRKSSFFKAGYFTDWVLQRVVNEVSKEKFLSEGFRVQTTIDYELQKVAEKEVLIGAKKIDKRQGFKGPIRKVEPLFNITEEEKQDRFSKISNESTYFLLTEEGTKEFQYKPSEEDFKSIIDKRMEFESEVDLRNFFSGNLEKDQLFNILKIDETYEAIVTEVNDKARLIFFSIGGLSGIINYDGFKWAHERVISEKKNLLPYVTQPSTIVSPGDVILVKIKNKNTGVWKHIYSSYKERLNTTKSKRLQKKVELLKKERYLQGLLDQNPDAQAALISLSPDSGEILSLVGGTNYIDSKFNRAIQSKRQPGSSFKPILFAAGLEHGFNPASILLDAPEALAGVDERLNWKPRNYDGVFKGPITFRNALEQSRNVPTIKLADKMGVENILNFTKRIGFNAKLDEDLSLALGSFGVSLLDIVSTYAIFPSGGKKIKPRAIISIVDRDGKSYSINNSLENEEQDPALEKVVVEAESIETVETEELEKEKEIEVNPFHLGLDENQVYDSRLSYIMCDLLKGIVQNGTGRGARQVSNFIGGKTGTTNSYVDAWFIGFSANVVTGVWTGFDDNKTLGWGETGAKSALPIWKEYMRNALDSYGEQDFSMPSGIINIQINKETGKTASQGERRLNFTESFVEGFEPGAQVTETTEEPVPSDQILEDDDYYSER